MSALLEQPVLRGAQGDLIFISISVDPHHLEDLLDQLSTVPFPINPELRHGGLSEAAATPLTRVEFPVFSGQLQDVVRALQLVNLGGTIQFALSLPMR
jgi:hypothetical protein